MEDNIKMYLKEMGCYDPAMGMCEHGNGLWLSKGGSKLHDQSPDCHHKRNPDQ
jgi:hypothetical protein